MPKELKEISTFVTGTITTPSSSDIPDDAASYSLNIDSVTQDGVLKGVPTDKTLQDSNPTDLSVNANELTVFDDDDKHPILYVYCVYDEMEEGDDPRSRQYADDHKFTSYPSLKRLKKDFQAGKYMHHNSLLREFCGVYSLVAYNEKTDRIGNFVVIERNLEMLEMCTEQEEDDYAKHIPIIKRPPNVYVRPKMPTHNLDIKKLSEDQKAVLKKKLRGIIDDIKEAK